MMKYILLTSSTPWWQWFVDQIGTNPSHAGEYIPSLQPSPFTDLFGWVLKVLATWGDLFIGLFQSIPPFILPVCAVYIAFSIAYLVVGRG